MIYFDNTQRNKPHFYVYYAEYKASVGVEGELFAGSLPVKQLRLVQTWAAIHEEELYRAWNNGDIDIAPETFISGWSLS